MNLLEKLVSLTFAEVPCPGMKPIGLFQTIKKKFSSITQFFSETEVLIFCFFFTEFNIFIMSYFPLERNASNLTFHLEKKKNTQQKSRIDTSNIVYKVFTVG